MYNGKWVKIELIKSKEKRSGLKPPFKELSHGKLSMRKQQNSLSWLVIILVPRALLTRGATRGSGQIQNRKP